MVGGVSRIGGLTAAAAMMAAALALPVPAASQASSPTDKPPGSTHEAIIGGGAPSAFQRCIEVEVGGDRGFGCLNQQLRREVDRVHPTLNMPPLDARSSDLRVGNVNDPAVRQQYGQNYGLSVYPFRPPAPVFSVPRR